MLESEGGKMGIGDTRSSSLDGQEQLSEYLPMPFPGLNHCDGWMCEPVGDNGRGFLDSQR